MTASPHDKRITPPRIVDVVFAHQRATHPRDLILAAIITCAFFILLLFLATQVSPSLTKWSDTLAQDIHHALHDEQEVTLFDFPQNAEPPTPAVTDDARPTLPPDPPSSTPSSPPPSHKARTPRPSSPSHQAAPPQEHDVTPPSGQSGDIIALDADTPAVDLTQNIFVTGGTTTVAGAASSGDGPRDLATSPPMAASQGSANANANTVARTRARSVQLDARKWHCSWPKEADHQEINEQSVILRVTVSTSGRVLNSTLLRDPGDGFGQAALNCAHRTRFVPATNEDGVPIEATSPPIRVRFTR